MANRASRPVGEAEAQRRASDEDRARLEIEIAALQAEVAAARAANIGEAVEGLKRAGLEAATTMRTEVQAVLASGVAEGQRAFSIAMEESGGELRATVLGLVKAVGDAADSVDRASGGFVRSGENAVRSAEALSGVTGQANSLVSSIAEVGQGFGTVRERLTGEQ